MILWHNPRCSKSRQALALLEARGATFAIRAYLDDAPSLAELHDLQRKLGLPAIAMMRPKEPRFAEMGLRRDLPDSALLEAMAAEPRLIERPVLIAKDRAVIGRPPERLQELL